MHPDTDGLPHVTTILHRVGLIDAEWYTDLARDRGKALHAAAHYLDEGDLDWETVDPMIVSRLRQYQTFLEEVKPQIIEVEKLLKNPPFYCGTPDRIVRIGERIGTLDLKSGAFERWHTIQSAMYAGCFPKPMARWSLHLSGERYQLIEHKDRRDWEVAKAAITLAGWKEAR